MNNEQTIPMTAFDARFRNRAELIMGSDIRTGTITTRPLADGCVTPEKLYEPFLKRIHYLEKTVEHLALDHYGTRHPKFKGGEYERFKKIDDIPTKRIEGLPLNVIDGLGSFAVDTDKISHLRCNGNTNNKDDIELDTQRKKDLYIKMRQHEIAAENIMLELQGSDERKHLGPIELATVSEVCKDE